MYEQKEKQVHHLEEVNMSLKQTNDDLNEELAELRRQLSDARQKVCVREGGGEQRIGQMEERCREGGGDREMERWRDGEKECAYISVTVFSAVL